MRKMAGYSLVIFFFFLIIAIGFNLTLKSNASYAPPEIKLANKIPASAMTAFDIPTLTQIPTPTNTLTPTPTPTPTNTPTPVPVIASADLEIFFSKYADEYRADKNLLEKIAKCESGFNANSNYKGIYLGMFQFAESSWISNRSAMGMDTNPDLRVNAEESIRTAAYMIAHGYQNSWPNCK